MAHELLLRVGGQDFGGWQAVRVHRRLDQMCAEFELQATENWPQAKAPREVKPGDACQLLVDGKPLITGYTDEVGLSHDAHSHTMAVRGRCKTADLVDCSAVHKPGSWSKQTLAQIASTLCKPFGIKVLDETADKTTFPVFAIQQGETVFEALERLARARAVLLTSNGAGDLVITKPSQRLVSTRVELGVNIIEATGQLNLRDRYSNYIIKGQAKGGDFWSGKAASAATARATDAGVPRYRPLVVISEAQGVGGTLAQRAAWEATVRAARSTEISVRVQGWAHAQGLWESNTRVRLVDRWLRLDDTLLVAAVTYQLDESGTTCELHMTRPDAFNVLKAALPQAQQKIKAAFWAPEGASK